MWMHPSASSLEVWDQVDQHTQPCSRLFLEDQYKLHEGSYTGTALEPLWLGGKRIHFRTM